MCYSAMVEEDYRKFLRMTGAQINLVDFMRLFGIRASGGQPIIPKGMEQPFLELEPETDIERQIAEHIWAFREHRRAALRNNIVKQRERITKAETTLARKATKKATDDLRIAPRLIADDERRLADLDRTTLEPRDSRIFSGAYALVMISEGGKRVVKPMRYKCLVSGKPKHHEDTYPGIYNARMDSLEGYWKKAFGHTHGVVLLEHFYEWVERTNDEGKVRKVELEFTPATNETLYGACLWSRWQSDDEDLLSFALITTDPPPEVRSAGHDRCIIPIQAADVDAWLNPDPSNLGAQYAILERRARPYYEHRALA